jgi:TBPIP/Hop2 winged helix domain
MAISSDIKQTIVNIMKEMSKQNKFINKGDIYTVVQNSVDYSSFQKALERLCDDGTIYSTYDNDIYSLND